GSRWGTPRPARAARPVSPGARRSVRSRRRAAGCRAWTRSRCVACGKERVDAAGRRMAVAAAAPAAGGASDRVAAFGAGLEAGLEAGLDELVQVAVEHLLGIAALDPGTQVLDPALVEHVVADLAAPADVGLAGLHRVLLGVALLQLELVELRGQHLHRAVAVGVLAALGLAGHHDPGGHVG